MALLGLTVAAGAQAQELVVPYERNYPPFSDTRLDGTPVGFNVAVAQAIAERAGYEITMRPVSFFQISDGNWPDDWAFSVASISWLEARKEHYVFVGEYLYDEIVLVAPTGTNPEASPPGEGDTVGVCSACAYRDYLEGNYNVDGNPGAAPFPGVGINTSFNSETSMIEGLISSTNTPFDYIVVSRFFAEFQFIVNKFPIAVIGKPLYRDPLWVVMSHNRPEMHVDLEKALQSLREDGTLTNLSVKFLGADFTTQTGIK
jgi:polar amino acid transport system substrate-binding protein